MSKLFEAVDSVRAYTLDEAKVTDYIDSDRLGEIVSSNSLFGDVQDCEPLEGMILKITSRAGISYYKVIKNDDGEFEAYIVDQFGKQLGDPFLLEATDINESEDPDEDEPLMDATPETKIKDWYTSYAPDDYQLDEINAETTFQDVKDGVNKYSINSLIGDVDSDIINTIINTTCDVFGIEDAYEFSNDMTNDRPAFIKSTNESEEKTFTPEQEAAIKRLMDKSGLSREEVIELADEFKRMTTGDLSEAIEQKYEKSNPDYNATLREIKKYTGSFTYLFGGKVNTECYGYPVTINYFYYERPYGDTSYNLVVNVLTPLGVGIGEGIQKAIEQGIPSSHNRLSNSEIKDKINQIVASQDSDLK